MFTFVVIVLCIVFGIGYYRLKKKNQEEEQGPKPLYFYDPIPFNLRMNQAKKQYLKLQDVDIEPEDQSIKTSSSNTVNATTQDHENDLLSPDDILINGDTGEMKMASDQFNETKFKGDAESTTIEPVKLNSKPKSTEVKINKKSKPVENTSSSKPVVNNIPQNTEKKVQLNKEVEKSNNEEWKKNNASAINNLFD